MERYYYSIDKAVVFAIKILLRAGMICCAQYAADKLWYRAEIIGKLIILPAYMHTEYIHIH